MDPHPDIDIIDIESSGLSSSSYPIEIAIALTNGKVYSALIRPIAEWTYWDETAAALHGITREQLLQDGKPIEQVCEEINQLCQDRVLYSDGWTYDSAWLNKLFGHAGVNARFRVSSLDPLLGENWSALRWKLLKADIAEKLTQRQHRALTDVFIIREAFQEYRDLLKSPLVLRSGHLAISG